MSALIHLKDAVIKPISALASPLFKNPLNLAINPNEKWAVIGSSKTSLLRTLASQYLATPATSRTYPFLHKSVWPSSAIQFLEFKGVLPTAHLSARYEFFKDDFDETTRKYVIGNVVNDRVIDHNLVDQVFKRLKLEGLEDRWVMGLSNGQTRRARLARALVREPKLLIVDDPFLGLDPVASDVVSDVLRDLPPNPYIVVGLRWQDRIPDWVTHVAVVDEAGIAVQGDRHIIKDEFLIQKNRHEDAFEEKFKSYKASILTLKSLFQKRKIADLPHIEFRDVNIAYRGQPVLSNLSLSISHGEKWHIQGANGTGKSTLLSLITAEHPQSWNSSIVVDGEPRKTGKSSFFEINDKIGFASPELHSIYPANHTVWDAMMTGFIVGSWVPPKQLTPEQNERVEIYLKEFDLWEKKDHQFSDLRISEQKVLLFIRALVKNPDLLILDEALSAMDDDMIIKCRELIRHFPGTVLSIGHLQSEVVESEKFVKLIGPGHYEIGKLEQS